MAKYTSPQQRGVFYVKGFAAAKGGMMIIRNEGILELIDA